MEITGDLKTGEEPLPILITKTSNYMRLEPMETRHLDLSKNVNLKKSKLPKTFKWMLKDGLGKRKESA